MSRLSIYETRWIDLVFENRNKEYGAYQMRRDSVKSTVSAFFFGLLFVASIGAIATISNHLNPATPIATTTTDWNDETIHVTKFVYPIEKTTPPSAQVQKQTIETPITQTVLRDPIIVKPVEANPDIATNAEIKDTQTHAIIGTETTTSLTSNTAGTETIVPSVDYGNTVVSSAIVDKMPEFPGGMSQFYKYVGKNFENPEIDAVGNIKILVYFVIEKDGSMSDIQVKRDPGYGLGAEAIRVLRSLKTKWAPGTIKSKPVRTAYNLPIIIKID